MIKIFKFGASLTLATLTLAGCSEKTSTSINSKAPAIVSTTAPTAVVGQTLTITDAQGAPIANARVMIGTKENVPFPGNIVTSDANGMIPIPAQWTAAEPVTIDATGFVRATYFETLPQTATLALNKVVSNQRFELKGVTTGFGNLVKDGFADVGVIFPALTRTSVATLSVTTLVSPEVDTISVFGQTADVPSNITIPKQTEDYIFPITIQKESYRAYLPTAGNWKMVSLHARFPFKKTIDSVRGGGSLFEMINTFDFLSGTVTDISITKASQSTDLAVNGVPYSKSLPFSAPRYDSKLKLLAVSLAETSGLYYVTDVKSVAPQGKIMLSTPTTNAGQGLIVAALRRPDAPSTGAGADEFTVVAMPANQSQAFDFLDLVRAPQYKSRVLNLDAPRAVASVNPVLTYGVLNKVALVGGGQVQLEQKTAQWELYAPSWATRMELPEMAALPAKAGDKFRWEVTFGGQPAAISSMPSLGPNALGQISHVVRSAVDL